MKVFLNLSSSIVLYITIFFIVLAFTLMNKYYIIHEYKVHNYYDVIKNNINNDIDVEYSLDDKLLKKDINDYINNYMYDNTYINKIIINDSIIPDEYSQIYNKNIKLIGPYNNYRAIRDVVDIITIILVALTGMLFIKTKKKHNLKLISIITGILGIITSFIILINIHSNEYINNILKDYYYIYLSVSILLVLTPLYISVYNKIVKKK